MEGGRNFGQGQAFQAQATPSPGPPLSKTLAFTAAPQAHDRCPKLKASWQASDERASGGADQAQTGRLESPRSAEAHCDYEMPYKSQPAKEGE